MTSRSPYPSPRGPPAPLTRAQRRAVPQKRECLMPGTLARRAGLGSLLPSVPWTPLPAPEPSPGLQAPLPGSGPWASRSALSSRHP